MKIRETIAKTLNTVADSISPRPSETPTASKLPDQFAVGTQGINAAPTSPFTEEAMKLVATQVQDLYTVAEAQVIMQNARRRLLQNPNWAAVDAKHAEIAQASLPDSPQKLAEVLLDRLEVTGLERAKVLEAVKLVLKGTSLPSSNMEPIGSHLTPDNFSTQMAVTDEGADHILMTLADPRMMNGAWLHCERINRVDRDGKSTPHALPYALPPLQWFELIRLLEGGDAPATVFYGSPNYRSSAIAENLPEGVDDQESAGLLNNAPKAVRELQMVARYAIARGASEVKVTMDGLSPQEAVGYMKEVSKPLSLDRLRHYLAAAFNLQSAVVDFKEGEPPQGAPNEEQQKLLLKVALKAIQLAKEGGFGKVTLDSASPKPPSYPLIEYFGVKNLFQWVREAHLNGLETYVSGGMQAYHFALLAMTGVDGVGVGTSIHESTPFAGITGRLVPGKVVDALDRRDKTESSAPGQLMYLLRRLDDKQGSGADLTDIERNLQAQATDLISQFAGRVDVDLNQLKSQRDTKLAELEAAKTAGTLPEADFTKQSKEAKETFAKAFEALVNRELNAPEFVAKSEKLVKQGEANGYPKREEKKAVGA